MKHAPEIQESLIKQFSFWRFQGEMIGLGFLDRGYEREAKELHDVLKTLDLMWLEELGSDYMDELLTLAKRYDEINDAQLTERVLPVPANAGLYDA